MGPAFIIPVARLTSDDYSAPKGSIGFGEPCEHLEGYYHVLRVEEHALEAWKERKRVGSPERRSRLRALEGGSHA